MSPVITFISLCLLLLANSNLFAAQISWHSHEDIKQVVESFILSEVNDASEVNVKVGRLDKRLKLAKCKQVLDVFWPPGAVKVGNATVGVRCDSEKPWKIYVQAKVEALMRVAVLSRPVTRGQSFQNDLVQFEDKALTARKHQALVNIKDIRGYRFKRAYAAGRVLTADMFDVPLLISKGESVTIVSNSKLLKVRMKGKALDDGSFGRIIKVKNLSSNRIIEGEVVARGEVRIHN